MGRKKKKQSKPWCWYCNREFDDEKILIQHQKAKHFKCHICHKKLYTGPGLSIHCMQVHKETIDKVPNSLPSRSNIEIEIYGMEGIPPEDIKDHDRLKSGGDNEDEDGPLSKRPKSDSPAGQASPSGNVLPGMTPAGLPLIPGLPHLRPPFPVAGMPPWSVPGATGPPATYSGPPTGPNGIPNAISRPMFPSAATTTSGGSKTTFPAYGCTSNSADRKAPTLTTTTATSRIVHPPEDISLEELRARHPKYAINTQTQPNVSSSSVPASVSGSIGVPSVSAQPGINSPSLTNAPALAAASAAAAAPILPPVISVAAAMNAPGIPPPVMMSMPLGHPVITASPMMAMGHRPPGMIPGLHGPGGIIQHSPVMMAAGTPMVRNPFVPDRQQISLKNVNEPDRYDEEVIIIICRINILIYFSFTFI
ncbi:BUB3-interacting and GLEBS motif-containing protein ZNF207 isoform X1 [Lepeophtheirus salmonis]|uniref:BUB3-interacting and GLEBS motif-containing protein ZNF207 isoform X1 n=1 Tax=Lepeophtheirus salmonis TaxID=72036 RepID=UPI003AF3C574